MSKRFCMLRPANDGNLQICDSNDHIYTVKPNIPRIYSITRRGYCCSVFLTDLTNKFGALGGFDKILAILSDRCKGSTVNTLCTIIKRWHCVFIRDFAQEFIPKFQAAVLKNVLQHPNIPGSRFDIENIITSFDSLLKRVCSIPLTKQILENFDLEVSIHILLYADCLKWKTSSLDYILRIIKKLKSLKNENHDDVCSEGLYKYLKPKMNDSKAVEIVWRACHKEEVQVRSALYQALSKLTPHFTIDLLNSILNIIDAISINEVSLEVVELVYKFTRSWPDLKPFLRKCSNLYLKIINLTTSVGSVVAARASALFSDLMKGWEFQDQGFNIILTCISNIRKVIKVLASIDIMKLLIYNYPLEPSTDKTKRIRFMDYLINKKLLLKVLSDEFKRFKETAAKKSNQYVETACDARTGDDQSSLEHLNMRMHFISLGKSNVDEHLII